MVESKNIQSCVSKKVSYIAHEKYGGSIPPDKRKQVLAIAYSYCRKSRKAKSDFFNSIFEKCLVTDFYVNDGMDDLIAWVLKEGLTKDPEEAKNIAFAISKARKGKKKGREKDWKKTWSEIAEDYEKRRKARKRLKEQRKGEKNQLQKSIYGVVDGEIVKDIQSKEKGRWITVKGTHIFIPKGKSVKETIEKRFKNNKDKIKRSKEKIEKHKALKESMGSFMREAVGKYRKAEQEINELHKRVVYHEEMATYYSQKGNINKSMHHKKQIATYKKGIEAHKKNYDEARQEAKYWEKRVEHHHKKQQYHEKMHQYYKSKSKKDGVIINDADLPFGKAQPSSFDYKKSKEIGGYDWNALRNIVGMEGPTLATPTGTQVIGTRMLTDYPMTAIGSSTVKGAGVFDNDLLVQFHDTSGTYRYHFDTPQEARQSFEDLVNARSAGEFIWQQFRGHRKGEPITEEKIGPAYFSGKPTIGGTTASLVEYDITGRTPQIKMPNYEALAEEMRKYKTMVKKPPESAEEFTPEELIASQRLKILQMLQEEFKKMGITTDFQEPEYVLGGTISRGGKFYYPQGWEKKNYYQLKDIYQEFGHIPAYSAMNHEGHNENELIGFGYDWKFTDPNETYPDGLVDSKIYVFPDVIKKYNLSEDKLFDIPVSVSQYDDADHRFTDYQNITDLYHIAVSLDKTLQDRCSLKGGHPCRVSIISDGTATNNKSAIDSIPNRKDGASGSNMSLGQSSYPQINKKEDKPMPNEINVDEILKQLLTDVEKLKKDGEQRADSLDTKTGEDSTAFQRIGDKEGFMKGCRDAGLSESKCNEAWNAKMAKGTGADKGGIDESKGVDKKTYDLAEIKELISKEIKDGISDALTKKDEVKETEEIKTFLKEKFGKEKCDFVDNLNLIELRAAKKTYELTHPEPTNDRDDMVSNAELFGPKQIQDFETRQQQRSAERLKTKWNWVGAL